MARFEVQVSLVDTATGRVLQQETVSESDDLEEAQDEFSDVVSDDDEDEFPDDDEGDDEGGED